MKKTILFSIIACILLLSSCDNNDRTFPTDGASDQINHAENQNGTTVSKGSANKSYSSGLVYKLDENNPYYIVSGIGKCTDTTVIIPEEYDGLPVREIGAEAFENCTSFTEIILPDSITSIKHSAFNNCKNLKSITLSDQLQAIGAYAFSSCAITNIELPEGLSELSKCTFAGCTELKSITLPKSIKYIRNSCFSGCTNLTDITLSEGLITIESGAFYKCTSLSEIQLPNSLQKLNGFRDCTALRCITIPENVTVVHANTFDNCYSLVEIYNYSNKDLSYLLENIGCECNIIDMN